MGLNMLPVGYYVIDYQYLTVNFLDHQKHMNLYMTVSNVKSSKLHITVFLNTL